MTLRDGIISHLAIVGAVSDPLADRTVYSIEQIGDHQDTADIVRRQFDGDDLMGISVEGQVKLPVPSGFAPFGSSGVRPYLDRDVGRFGGAGDEVHRV